MKWKLYDVLTFGLCRRNRQRHSKVYSKYDSSKIKQYGEDGDDEDYIPIVNGDGTEQKEHSKARSLPRHDCNNERKETKCNETLMWKVMIHPQNRLESAKETENEKNTWKMLDSEQQSGPFPPLTEWNTGAQGSSTSVIQDTSSINFVETTPVTVKRSSDFSVWTEISFDEVSFKRSNRHINPQDKEVSIRKVLSNQPGALRNDNELLKSYGKSPHVGLYNMSPREAYQQLRKRLET